MTDFEKKIIKQLKEQLEFDNPSYSQWLLGVSLPTIIEQKDHHLTLTARVVVKTNESDLVDGMDISFTLEPIIDPGYYENSPDYMGGTIEDSVHWLNHHGKIVLEQLEDPFETRILKELPMDELNQLENNSLESRCSNDHDN